MVFRGAAPAGRDVPPLAFVGGVAGGSLLGQIVLTGGPVALAALGGAPERVTGLFVALAVLRAPYMVATGVATRITGTLTLLVTGEQWAAIRRLRSATAAACAVGAPLVAGLGYAAGPALLRLVFGPDVDLPGGIVAVVAAGSLIALAVLFAMLLLVAAARVAVISVAWLAASAAAVAWCLAGPGSPLTRVVWAFAVAEALALAVMLAVPLGRDGRSGGG
jgi:hypothetical protein